MSETLTALLELRRYYLDTNAGGDRAYGNVYASALHTLQLGAPGISESTREVLAHSIAKKAVALADLTTA